MMSDLADYHPDRVTFYSTKRWPPPKWVSAADYRELYEITREYERRLLRDAPLAKEAINTRIEARNG